jgi:beta-xylosidase
MTDEEKRAQFHAGETALYITRADHRVQTGKLDELKRLNASLQERLQQLERREQTAQKLNQLRAVLSDEDREYLKKLIIDELKEDAARSK